LQIRESELPKWKSLPNNGAKSNSAITTLNGVHETYSVLKRGQTMVFDPEFSWVAQNLQEAILSIS
jgi:hypothetical protein